MRHLLVSLLPLLVLGCTADTFTGDDGGGDAGNQDVVDPPDGDPPSETSTGDGGTTGDGDGGLPDVVVPPTHYRIFATSQTHNANLGGLSGADSICTAAGAKLGGTGHWMAWLSSSQTDAKTRLFHSTIPYVRVDGVQIAADWAHFTNGSNLDAPICIDENGNDVNAGDAGTRWAMTGTDQYGLAFLQIGTCDDFTSSTDTNTQTVAGMTSSNGHQQWTSGSAWGCAQLGSLYCIEQP